MAKHWWLPLAILCAGAVAVWPLREHLTAAEIAARSPRETWLAALFLLALYTLKGLSVAFPLSRCWRRRAGCSSRFRWRWRSISPG